jgi:hypothetical protein
VSGDVRDLMINLAASLVVGVAVWAAQRLLRHRAVARKLAFFGLTAQDRCLVVVPKHASSPREHSVHRQDVAALVEVASVARECGATAELVAGADPVVGLGRMTEFCVGGWFTNPRTATHLSTVLPGVRPLPYPETGPELAFTVGSVTYRQAEGHAEYAVLARAFAPASGRPVFILAGQSAESNLAAARFLTANIGILFGTYRADRPFCLVLRLVEPESYGPDLVEATDVTDRAFTRPATVDGRD